MDKIASLLKVDNATEETVLASVQSTLNKVKELEEKNEALIVENKEALELVEAMQEEKKAAEAKKATDLIENAVKEGKISEESKEAWNAFAAESFEAAEKAINGIQNTVKPSISKIIENTTKSGKSLAQLRADLK